MEDYLKFGQEIWSRLRAQPFGSLTKRELELVILRSAVECRLLHPRAESLAAACSTSLSRAHSYLTDLALRHPPLTDPQGISRLLGFLRDSEVVQCGAFFSIPLSDPQLRIWVERKMASLQLNTGDSLRRDHVRLTSVGLARIISASEGVFSPYDALKRLPTELQDVEWVKAAKKNWKKGMSWLEVMDFGEKTIGIAELITTLLFNSLT